MLNFLKSIGSFIFKFKKIIFIYIPFIFSLILGLYILFVYFNWQGDKTAALQKLSRYKKLIDRTEDLKKGYVYSSSEVSLNAGVVDLPTRIFDRNNQIIGEFFEQKREIVPYNYIPKWLVKGVIASEDRKFYEHNGINYMGIFRALIINTVNLRVVQGGSTITQQLAKVLFTNMERNIKRKIYESFCAIEIENLYDKQDILSMYLNLIYFGKGAYGVESASKMFFGKSVKKLNVVECATIVATISSPKSYSPISNLPNSISKTKRILKSLVDAGFANGKIMDYKYKKYLEKWDVKFDKSNKAISSLIGSFILSSYRVNRAPFFNERVRRILVERFGEAIVKKGGLNVYTTINAEMQDIGLVALRRGVLKQRNYHIKKSKKIRNTNKSNIELKKAENIEGALITISPETGEILNYIGGYNFSSNNQNDNVSQILRQPGSSIKPIVYTAAIEERAINPSTVFVDKKTVFKGGYSPSNYHKKFKGKIIVREALRKSLNTVAVKVLVKCGYDKPFEIIQKSLNLGNSRMNKRFKRTLSFALGTYEISPLENAVLHSTIVNGGKFIKPFGIKFVKDYNGNIVWNNEEEVAKEVTDLRKKHGNIIDPEAAAIMVSILKNPKYYAVKKLKLKFENAGKTGTSSNWNDAWFVGYTSKSITAIWIGNKTGAISLGRGRAGGVLSVPVWSEFVSKAFRSNPPGKFRVPTDGLTIEKICIKSGKVALQDGSCDEFAVQQLYYSGSEPGKFCDIHNINILEKVE